MSQHSRNNPDEAPVHDVFLGVVHVTTPRDDLTYQQRVDAHQAAMEPQFKTVDALKSLQAQLGCQPATSMADVYATQTAAIERLTKENVELGSALKHLLELEKKWMSRNKGMNDRYLKVCGENANLKLLVEHKQGDVEIANDMTDHLVDPLIAILNNIHDALGESAAPDHESLPAAVTKLKTELQDCYNARAKLHDRLEEVHTELSRWKAEYNKRVEDMTNMSIELAFLKTQLADYQRYGEVRETQRLLREWREMKEALEDIAKNDKESKFGEGICCYGCDSPHIARECLTKINGGGQS